MDLSLFVFLWNLLTHKIFPHSPAQTTVSEVHVPTRTISISLSPSPSPSPKPTPTPVDIQKPITGSPELLREINSFRSQQQIQRITTDAYLCTIANARARELYGSGQLDNHNGYQQYVGELQQNYNAWGEIIHTASSEWNAREIILQSWATSNTGHREAMLNAAYNKGCGSIQGNFAVFIFGAK